MQKSFRSDFNSRQYMISKGFEIFYYSDRNFHSIDSHHHDYYEYYFFVEGSVDIEIRGVSRTLIPGDVIVIPPGISHRAVLRDANTTYRRFILWISRDYFETLSEKSADYIYLAKNTEENGEYVYHFNDPQFNALRGKLYTALEEINTDRFGRDTRITICLYDLLLLLSRMAFEQKQPPRRELSSRYETITAYIDQHLSEELSLEMLSHQFFLNKYYIAHMFQEIAGLSLHQYITKKRLAVGKDAMRCGAQAAEACAAAGFKDYSSFYRAFRKEYNTSPSAYQRRCSDLRE